MDDKGNASTFSFDEEEKGENESENDENVRLNVSMEHGDGIKPLDQETLKKYISYSRAFCRPVIHEVDSEKVNIFTECLCHNMVNHHNSLIVDCLFICGFAISISGFGWRAHCCEAY